MNMTTYVIVRKHDGAVVGLVTTQTRELAIAAGARRWTHDPLDVEPVPWDNATREQQHAATEARKRDDAAEQPELERRAREMAAELAEKRARNAARTPDEQHARVGR